MYERSLLKVLKKRIEREKRKFIQVIYGPRQTGKTTLVTQFASKTNIPNHYVSADATIGADGSWIIQHWNIARLKLKRSQLNETVLILDEIQKVKNWSEYVKKEWDEDSRNGINLKVIMLGSSRLILQEGLTESLTGRFETNHLTHWSYNEMKSAFQMNSDQFVWFGGYPGAAVLINDENRWKSYIRDAIIETSISKDILMMIRIDKPLLLKRLFELGSVYSGQILSFNKIMGQIVDAGNTTTLANYLELLKSAGLLTGLEKYSPEIIRIRSSSPRFQVFNNALLSAQSNFSFETIRNDPVKWGHWAESAVGAHLLNSSFIDNYRLYYWRYNNNEVDFVIEKGNKIVAIEVKSGTGKIKKGMETFRKRYNPSRVYLVGETGIRWEEFLQTSPNELF
jgi:predicted AAA+ superfamily ATPase